MSDLISRQAAIDALGEEPYGRDDDEYDLGLRNQWQFDVDAIKTVPAAQPEITLESAIDYLHSIGWLQEHDRIMSASAQPERKKGRWMFYDSESAIYDDIGCPFCKKIFTVDAYRRDDIGFTVDDLKFCPNCGAEMEGEIYANN